MTARADGGPAFPNITPDMPVDGGPGMSLRDWFAGQAMHGIVAGFWANPESLELPDKRLALLAYGAADAMLAAREDA